MRQRSIQHDPASLRNIYVGRRYQEYVIRNLCRLPLMANVAPDVKSISRPLQDPSRFNTVFRFRSVRDLHRRVLRHRFQRKDEADYTFPGCSSRIGLLSETLLLDREIWTLPGA